MNKTESVIQAFAEHHITWELLADLNEECMDKLEIYAVGDRIRLQRALSQLAPVWFIFSFNMLGIKIYNRKQWLS